MSDTLLVMTVTTRTLLREFTSVKEAARKGQAVEVRDGKTGEVFLLTAKPTRTFGDLAEAAKGAFSGPKNLSAREGFDV